MGYRSYVAMMVYGDPHSVDMVDNLLLQKLDPEYDRGMFESAKQTRDEDVERKGVKVVERSILWTFGDIKWYTEMQNYQDFVRSLVEQMTDGENGAILAFEFVRIGENHDDVEEERVQDDYRIGVIRDIALPANFEWRN